MVLEPGSNASSTEQECVEQEGIDALVPEITKEHVIEAHGDRRPRVARIGAMSWLVCARWSRRLGAARRTVLGGLRLWLAHDSMLRPYTAASRQIRAATGAPGATRFSVRHLLFVHRLLVTGYS